MLTTNQSEASETTKLPKENFPTYLLTPYEPDENPFFKDALVQPDAPGRSVCMSLLHYEEARSGYDTGKIYKKSPCSNRGFSLIDVGIIVVVALVLGAAAEKVFHESAP